MYGGRFILRAVFLPFTWTMGPQFQLTVRVSLAAIWVAVSAPSPHIPGDRDQLPGARCSHQGLRGARGAATNIRMSLQPMFTVSPARYNHNSMEISRVILIVQWWCSCLKYALFYLTLTSILTLQYKGWTLMDGYHRSEWHNNLAWLKRSDCNTFCCNHHQHFCCCSFNSNWHSLKDSNHTLFMVVL